LSSLHRIRRSSLAGFCDVCYCWGSGTSTEANMKSDVSAKPELSKYARKRRDEQLGSKKPFEFKTTKVSKEKPRPPLSKEAHTEEGAVEATVVRLRGLNDVFLETADGVEIYLSLRLLARNLGNVSVDVGSKIICMMMENRPPSPPGFSASKVLAVV